MASEAKASKNRLVVTAPPGQPSLRMEREFDAPRSLVWQAFTRAEHMAQWWGPRKYTPEVKEYDVRVGGKWRIVQTGDGQRHQFSGEFRVVQAPEVLAWTFGYMNYPPLLETMRFEDLGGGRTRVVVEGSFSSVAERDGMVQSGMESGARESYERLEELLDRLAKAPGPGEPVVVRGRPAEISFTREFDAPRDLVFDVWTGAEHIPHWFAPYGIELTDVISDPRPGGAFRLRMHLPEGRQQWLEGDYKEVIRPSRIVMGVKVLDKDGKALFEVVNAATFEERGGKTLLTLHAMIVRIHDPSIAEPSIVGMEEGWRQTLERFATRVADTNGAKTR